MQDYCAATCIPGITNNVENNNYRDSIKGEETRLGWDFRRSLNGGTHCAFFECPRS